MKLNIEKLYKAFGDTLEYTYIDLPDEGCFDLIDEFGELLAMNGDDVKVVKIDKGIIMCNCFDGLRFVLTTEEFNVGIEFETEKVA